MKKKSHDKGFSLVELIVVVLIIGIITTALVPQAMKWVGTARKGADSHVQDNLKSVGQLAIAEYQNKGGILVDAEYNVTSAGISPVGGTDLNSGMTALLQEYMGGEFPKVQNQSGKVYQIEIKSVGTVTISVVSGTY